MRLAFFQKPLFTTEGDDDLIAVLGDIRDFQSIRIVMKKYSIGCLGEADELHGVIR